MPGAGQGIASPARPPASPHIVGQLGSPGNPVVLSCAAESWPGPPDPPVPANPGPHDLAIGPMYFADALALATKSPSWYGYAPFGRHGRFYKIGLVVRPGATVTVTIGASATGHAAIAGVEGSGRGATSVTYHACRKAGGFYAQGFAFIHPPFRGCVPLDVMVSGKEQLRHITLSLFAGSCAA